MYFLQKTQENRLLCGVGWIQVCSLPTPQQSSKDNKRRCRSPPRRKRRGFLRLLGLFSRDGFGGPDGTEDASPGHRHGIGLRSLTGEPQPWAEPGCSDGIRHWTLCGSRRDECGEKTRK